MKSLFILSLLSLVSIATVSAQVFNLPYGEPISLEQAKTVVEAAKAEAAANEWAVVVIVVDAGGHLVAAERMDTTQHGSIEVAMEKARTATAFRRATKAFEEIVAGGGEGLRILSISSIVAVEGGLPLVIDGKIVGAIGVSGVTPMQDGQIAAAGGAVLSKP